MADDKKTKEEAYQEHRSKQIENINRYNWSGHYDWAHDADRALKIADKWHEEEKQKGQNNG